MDASVQTQAGPRGICGLQSGTGIVYSLTGYLGLLCQYHSANVTYSSFHPSITCAI